MCTDLFFHPFFQRDREGPEHVQVNCSPSKSGRPVLYQMSDLRGYDQNAQIPGFAFVRPLC